MSASPVRDLAKPSLSFEGFADFVPAFNAARQAAAEVFGPRWDLHPAAFVRARLPAAWAHTKVAGRTVPRLHPPSAFHRASPDDGDSLSARNRLPDEVIGARWSQAPRDQKLPVARFWPGGVLPVGPDYEASPPIVKPAKPRLIVRNADPPKPRRPAGIGLASGYDRADGDFYAEPRWLVDALLRHEPFDGPVLDPCCGGGSIVSALRDAGYTADGSDLYDRGFGVRADVLQLNQPLASVVCNPPFKIAEAIVWHLLPLLKTGGKLAMLLRLSFLESEERRELFSQTPLARVWVSRKRASMPPGRIDGPRDHNGALIPAPASGGSTPYAWLVWEPDRLRPTTVGWL